jgi:hypothetical protein
MQGNAAAPAPRRWLWLWEVVARGGRRAWPAVEPGSGARLATTTSAETYDSVNLIFTRKGGIRAGAGVRPDLGFDGHQPIRRARPRQRGVVLLREPRRGRQDVAVEDQPDLTLDDLAAQTARAWSAARTPA